MEKRQHQFSIGYFVIAFFLILMLQNFLTAPHVQLLDYSETTSASTKP